MTITLRGIVFLLVRRGCNTYGTIPCLAIGMQKGCHGTYLGLQQFHSTNLNGTIEKREWRKRGPEELITALTKQQKEAMQKLQARYEGDPKPINSSISISGGQ